MYTVTEEQAMKIPTFKACIDLVSTTVAQLPINLFHQNTLGNVEQIQDSRVLLLNDKPNKRDSAAKFKRLLAKDLVLYGKAYLLKDKKELFYLEASKMDTRYFTENGMTIAKRMFTYNGYRTVELDESQLIVFDIGSYGALVDGSEILQHALNEQNYRKAVFTNGALPIGVLKSSSRLTQQAIDRLRQSFENLYSGTKNSSKTMILEEGLDYQALSLDPQKLMMNETAKETTSSICRLLNVPESMVNSSANKYGSLEIQNRHFLQFSIGPILSIIESAFNQSLLEQYELSEGKYFRFETAELLRATEKELIEATSKMFKDGLISLNEARTKIDYKKVDKDYYSLSLGSALKDAKTDEITVVNLGTTIDMKGTQEND